MAFPSQSVSGGAGGGGGGALQAMRRKGTGWRAERDRRHADWDVQGRGWATEGRDRVGQGRQVRGVAPKPRMTPGVKFNSAHNRRAGVQHAFWGLLDIYIVTDEMSFTVS